ncbi:MAG: hypothetical protein ABSF36_07745 [Candidatus Methanomethylicaceae archaeon]|jgi:hypothetical protein
MPKKKMPYTHADVVKKELAGTLKEGKKPEKFETQTHADQIAREMGAKEEKKKK